MIPKILLQTSKNKLDQYVLDDLGNFIAGWKYLHFTDLEIVQFFKHNPLQQFPDIVEVFENIPCGEYKADLFRYYFLYLNGGVFVDSDLQLKIDLNYYVENFSYFTTQACHPNETCYFQGLLAAEPKNKIIYEALVDTYNLFKSNHQLSFYTELCHRFKQISLKHESEYLVKLFDETPHDGYTTVFDKLTGKDVAVHFHEPGIIPPPVLGEENTSRKQIIRAVYLNYLKREPDESGLQNYLNTNLVVAEIVNDILSSQEFKKLHDRLSCNLKLNDNSTTIFTDVYNNAMWSLDKSDIYCSGDGSSKDQIVIPYIDAVEKFITQLDFKPNILDIGCGNFLVGSKTRHNFNEYIAIDVVPHVIEYIKNKYSSLNVNFGVLDAVTEELPDADIVIIRQVFQHLSNEAIATILHKLTKYEYLILTEHVPKGNFIPNINKPSDAYVRHPLSGVVITEEPFNLVCVEQQVLCVVDGNEHGGLFVTTCYKLK